MAAAAGAWVAWEPPEWVAARGAAPNGVEGQHFVVRWGAACDDAFDDAAAVALLSWLERAWALLCAPGSAQRFVTPYTTRGWCADDVLRKLNVYVGATGLAPWPADAAWAHQGTWVEHGSGAWHDHANPSGKLHHSYLALAPGAARCEATCVHELTHVLQMHTGGHVDSPRVGYAWEAHAEYCVHLYRPHDAAWAHGVAAFLESAHLPPGATRITDGGGDGRQYTVWPFFGWVDRCWGAGAAHALWHDDYAHRCSGAGGSRDAVTTLAARLGGWPALGDALGDWALAVATAHFAADAAADAAIRASADPLAPRRLARLRAQRGADATWRCDAARPLKQHGVCVHRLQAAPGGNGVASVRVLPGPGVPPGALRYALVGFDAATGVRVGATVLCAGAGDDAGVEFEAQAGLAWLLAVTAAPAAPVAVPWGIDPSALPTHAYTVCLRGCRPHDDCCPPPPPPPPLLLLPPLLPGTQVTLPTGLPNLLCGAGPASLTDADVRSGCPGESALVWLRHALPGPARLVAVAFAYRAVVGYSGNTGPPGPRFELVAAVEADEADDDAGEGTGAPPLRVMWSSPEFDARPWHYDACLGGGPRNYCPRRDATAACDVTLQPGQRMRLGLRFVNGARNCHLQGGAWPDAPPGDLQLRFTLAPL